MKMRKIRIAMIALSMTVLVSCKDEAKTEQATPTQSEVETNENPKTTVAVNPAHGLPGHRCDLPVGAPLDGSAQTQTQQATQPATTTSSSVSPVRVDQTPRLNPPHGQPGHDCTIPVGAELKQKQ